ncbi:MAG: S-methyl-5'-thioadenosine phosphorylase, partial [Thermoprotei archaeon]
LVPEVNLARELGLCYSTLALVTDYDVWAEKPVTAKEVVETQRRNIENANKLLYSVVPFAAAQRGCSCSSSLEQAFT